MSLRERIATADGKRRVVRAIFATIADRYDLITVVLSYGQDQRWKRRLIDLAQAGPGARALDLATGTGDLAFALAARGARVVGLDVTFRMIELAIAKRATTLHVAPGTSHVAAGTSHVAPRTSQPAPRTSHLAPVTPGFLVGDMQALPFPPRSFDIVTTGYGLRNVPNLATAIEEIHRVLSPGGRMLSLDFNRPSNLAVRSAYLAYLTLTGAALGWLLHRDPDTYRYIPASIRHYPGAEGVARMFEARGFTDVRWYPVLGGLMTIHHAIRA
jgi:ubiquinone/menaquinone biosynthesis C-methylase UbiE